jgi:ATP-dependent DNA helicase Q1
MYNRARMLGVPTAVVLDMLNRPNLTTNLLAQEAMESLKQLGKIINDRVKNQSGIVYCLSQTDCMDVCDYLI